MKKLLVILIFSLYIYAEPVTVKDAYDNTVEVVSTEDFNAFKKDMQQYIELNKLTDDELIDLSDRVDKLDDQLKDFIKKIREFQKLLK
ncbi:MAG: hypothetical protein P4L22_06570 [Candidatus Babeliales bacterium]|nr:hypothetical protein [Candidatus Babeliales bacterium]